MGSGVKSNKSILTTTRISLNKKGGDNGMMRMLENESKKMMEA